MSTVRLQPPPEGSIVTAREVASGAVFELPGQAMDLALDGRGGGYITVAAGSDGEGAIIHDWGDGDVSPTSVVCVIPGCVNALEVVSEYEAIATVFTYQGDGLLYLISFEPSSG